MALLCSHIVYCDLSLTLSSAAPLVAIKVALARNIWNSTRSAPPHLTLFDDSQIVRTLENVLEMLCQEGSRSNFNLFAGVTRCNTKSMFRQEK